MNQNVRRHMPTTKTKIKHKHLFIISQEIGVAFSKQDYFLKRYHEKFNNRIKDNK